MTGETSGTANPDVAGVLIAESIRVGASLEDLRIMVRRIRRLAPEGLLPEQPPEWSLIDFTAAASDAEALAQSLADVLDSDPAWYADFHSDTESFVVYPGRVFRYPRGSSTARAEAIAHGRRIGIPEAQLDWQA